MSNPIFRAALIVTIPFLAACEGRLGDSNQTTDGGLDGGLLKDGAANIWVDPDGCQHWYIDDGIEGYMTPRINPKTLHPVCGAAEDTRTAVLTKDGSTIVMEPEPSR